MIPDHFNHNSLSLRLFISVSVCTFCSFADFKKEAAAVEQARHDRTPVAKRVAYSALGVSSPFCTDWHSLLGLDSSQIPRVLRGALLEQFELLARKRQANVEIDLEHVLVPVKVKYNKGGHPKANAILSLPQDKSELNTRNALQDDPRAPRCGVGALTSCGFSFVRGCGWGLGFCRASDFLAAPASPKKPNARLLLVRNTNSLRLRCVRVSLLHAEM
jgi:hypothetical protein